MRKAFHAENLVPDKKWLIYTSLIWDKVVLEPFDLMMNIYPAIVDFPEWKDSIEFAFNMIDKTDIVDYELPKPKFELLSDKEMELWVKTSTQGFEEISIVSTKLRGKANSIGALLDKYCCKIKENKKIESSISENMINMLEAMISMKSKMLDSVAKVHFPSQIQHAFPDMDFFYNSSDVFSNNTSSRNCLVKEVEAIVPINIETITISQIEDFRARYFLHRNKFRIEANKLLDSILECSTEKSLQKNLKLCEEALMEQINILQINFRKCMIDSTKQTLGITLGAPALVTAFSSLLNIPFYVPAAIISSLSISAAEILNAIEKNEMETSKSPWAYLWYLKKNFA